MTDWGDHVFADLAEPSRQSGWQTGAIVWELHHEIEVLNSNEYKLLADEGILIEKDIISCTFDDYNNCKNSVIPERILTRLKNKITWI